MPFSKTTEKRDDAYWTSHYDKFLKPSIERENPVLVERSNPVRGDIIIDIISKLISSDIVVVDVTDANPNVYWELGVRQSFKHGTITIAEDGTKLPFDISGKGTLFYYPDNHIKNTDFILALNNAIKDCINNPDRPDSRVLETITGRGSFYEILNKEEVIRKLQALSNEFNSNKKTYKLIINRVHKNQQSDEKRYSTSLFRLSSIELLISTRYLNVDNKFYQLSESYYNHLNSVNSRLEMWPYRADSVEKWLLRVMDDKIMKAFYTGLDAEIKNI